MRSDCSLRIIIILLNTVLILFFLIMSMVKKTLVKTWNNIFVPCSHMYIKHIGHTLIALSVVANAINWGKKTCKACLKLCVTNKIYTYIVNFTCANYPFDANIGGVYLFGEFLHSLRGVFICVWVHVGLYSRERDFKRRNTTTVSNITIGCKLHCGMNLQKIPICKTVILEKHILNKSPCCYFCKIFCEESFLELAISPKMQSITVKNKIPMEPSLAKLSNVPDIYLWSYAHFCQCSNLSRQLNCCNFT